MAAGLPPSLITAPIVPGGGLPSGRSSALLANAAANAAGAASARGQPGALSPSGTGMSMRTAALATVAANALKTNVGAPADSPGGGAGLASPTNAGGGAVNPAAARREAAAFEKEMLAQVQARCAIWLVTAVTNDNIGFVA